MRLLIRLKTQNYISDDLSVLQGIIFITKNSMIHQLKVKEHISYKDLWPLNTKNISVYTMTRAVKPKVLCNCNLQSLT